ncbi:F-box/LRR-repeat protein At3g26922-like [Triticum aestivum]|uniref:F-box/LRR-repeat protein At3g26922-like n=1 Tax=Triticum aestivum TaxID=4565 RepID=UPI001D01A533|nr:F-box/LRR-repeat protein At3g26922-like [Triticum aestivum]
MASSCDPSTMIIIRRRRQVVSPEDLYARQMFDRTLLWRKSKTQWTSSGPDGLSALPDDAIRHVIGFLPARDAVQTSALARGWRSHWRSMHSLRFTPVAGSVTVAGLKRLVGPLLLDLRTPLDECVIDVKGFWQLHGELNSLIRHGVSECRVRALTVSLVDTHRAIYGQPLVSRHLARLELRHVTVPAECTVLDFSSCMELEDLVISCSQIYANKLSSPSLKRLKIEECCLFPRGSVTCISAPNIVSLELDNIRITTPWLERMPLLETACVRLGHSWPLHCQCGVAWRSCGVCTELHLMELASFSSATHLELTAPYVKFTVLRCPTFSKLKSLSLNEWCVADDLSALICILEHSPLLENLTLQLNEF